MKKSYMHTIIGPSERDCVSIILLQLYGSNAGLFEGRSVWPPTFILEELIQ